MQTNLARKVAVVTGASQGIGEAIARALHGEGAKVALLARRVDALDRVVASLGEGALAVRCDVTDADSVEKAMAAVRSRFGRIDILVNNAGGLASSNGELFRPLDRIPDKDWIGTFDLNVVSAARAIRAVAPGMIEAGWGRIINISSENGEQPDPVAADYNAAKAALNALSRTVAKAYGEQGIRTNTVSPAYVDTPIVREVLAQLEGSQDVAPEDLMTHFLKAFRPNINVGRPGRPEDVAAAVAFLASEAADFINGVNLRVDGGSVSTI
jgi:3-oxoacyl-[acyl-carrier protein] reductase